MSGLDKYVEWIEKYIEEHPDITEEKIIRYVYLDLGKRFSFDLNFAFGNSKIKRNIYKKSKDIDTLENAIEIYEGNCKVISNVLKYVLKKIGVDITTEVVDNLYTKCPHVYNIITQKDGKRYSVDLQMDLKNIQSHSFTKRYGLSLDTEKPPIFKRFDIEKMDRELGYIDDIHYYSDDYLYMLKADLDLFSDYGEKIKFLLEHIDICENKQIKYAERKWNHESILRKVLSKKELKKIQLIDCYVIEKGEKKYMNYIAVDNKGKTEIYEYDIDQNAYKKISLDEFAIKVKKGLVVLQKIQGLNKKLKKIQEDEERSECINER